MRITFPQFLTPKAAAEKTRRLPRERTLELMALAAILLLAAVLRFSNLDAIGYANTYYTAAVKSMLQSWHNFFFVAAEPGGSVTVDKPPVGFWLQAVSAYFLGVNGFAVVLPQLIAGLLSVILIDYLVRRSFGMFAGLLAALVLAVTPVVIATDRNNTIDSTLILTLLLAAWAFIKAAETARLRYLLLGAVLVGIGFNIKMLQAYLPLPAFYALYFLKSSERLRRKVGQLALASALLLVISLSWSLAVDLTPAGQRPYVGSSGDNSELSLIVGYNGIQRLLGMFGRRGGAPAGGPPAGFPQSGLPQGDEFPPVGQDDGGSSGFPQSGPDGAGFPQPGGPGGASGFMGTGQPGPLRLFISPLSKEMSWLLPFGILSILLLTFRGLRTAPSSPEENTGIRPSSFVVRPSSVVHRLPSSLLLWSTWLLTGLIFLSIAGFPPVLPVDAGPTVGRAGRRRLRWAVGAP